MTTTSADDSPLPVTDRTRLRRKPDRGSHRFEDIAAILGEGIVAHVGFTDAATPIVMPMVHARVGDQLYLHGATGNHMLRCLTDGRPVSVTVTLLDGLVLSRSAFHHSVNYRSAIIFGTGREATSEDEKRRALDALVEQLVAGRTTDARPPTPPELRATRVVAVPITEASAKVRTGDAIEEPADLDLPVWAGQIPLRVTAGDPIPAADQRHDVPLPDYIAHRTQRG